MRATYDKLSNCITVEFREEDAKYIRLAISKEDSAFNSSTNSLQIPCSRQFYQNSQRQKGGVQTWDQEQLRAAVRGTVASYLLPVPTDMIAEHDQYREAHWGIQEELTRNIRLLFPSQEHPAPVLTREEMNTRREWRRRHGLQ